MLLAKPLGRFWLVELALRLVTMAIVCSVPSSAKVNVADELHTAYDACIKKFSDAKLRDLVDELDRSPYRIDISSSGAGSDSHPKDDDDATNSVGTGGTMKWNPNGTSKSSCDGIRFDPCATLYHEMRHQVDYTRGTNDDRNCTSSSAARKEVEATRAENRYRGTQPDLKDALRTCHGKSGDIPSDDTDCHTEATKRRPRAGCNSGCAMSNGDVHLTTFDQKLYDFQAVGEFVLARAASSQDFEVQVRQAKLPDVNNVSVNSAVAMNVDGTSVSIYATEFDPVVKVGSKEIQLGIAPMPLNGGGEIVKAEDGELIVTWTDGSMVRVYSLGFYGLRLQVEPDASRAGLLEGLLGNFDGNKDNDMIVANSGKLIADEFEQLYGSFDDSWRVGEKDTQFDYPPGQSTATYTDRDFPSEAIEGSQLPNSEHAESICRASGTADPNLLRSCILDVAATGAVEFARSTSALEQEKRRRPTALRLSGGLNGELSRATTKCSIIGDNQFVIDAVGYVSYQVVEMHITILGQYNGASTYSIGSVLGEQGSAVLQTNDEVYVSNGASIGTLNVVDAGFSGTVEISLSGNSGKVDVTGQWVCNSVLAE